MSAHRTHYALDPTRRHIWRSTLAAIAIAAVLAVITVAASQGGESVGPVATPVRMPDVQIYPLEPLDGPHLASLRVEAFRAGYQSAVHDGCRPPALATPIAQVRP